MGQRLLRKLDFAKKEILEKINLFSQDKPIFLSVGENFTFANACAIRIKQGTKTLSKRKCDQQDGLLAKRIKN